MSYLNLTLLPTDVLFFRDGRPIDGSLSGYGAAWPMPSVINAALHAALHRGYPVNALNADSTNQETHLGDHLHRSYYKGKASSRARRFGSIQTVGPFPVNNSGDSQVWYFPRPLDLGLPRLLPTLSPNNVDPSSGSYSSLPKPLKYPVASWAPPSKNAQAPAWLDLKKFEAYLGSGSPVSELEGVNDMEIFDAEKNIGIAIDSETKTVEEGKFYSAQYLRLREHWRLGELVTAGKPGELLLFKKLFGSGSTGEASIIVGGQQRVCTARIEELNSIPLPHGLTSRFNEYKDHKGCSKYLLKWILLSPAIWPEIGASGAYEKREPRRRNSDVQVEYHPGGWLPNWVHPDSGRTLLRKVNKDVRRQRRQLNYKNQGYSSDHGNAPEINARLVSALVSKPVSVSGWSLGFGAIEEETKPGAKSNHLAAPAGSVYYFEADSHEDAVALASVLNWHGGAQDGLGIIKNRRSSLMGEKGFGIGVCGTWGTPKS